MRKHNSESTEEKILKILSEAWNIFLQIEENPDEINDFKSGIQKCQQVIALRIGIKYGSLIPYYKMKGILK